jgi:hypothetical protein
MSLRVIGAGFGRTGTSSMRDALNKLGFVGPCHHMSGVLKHRSSSDAWICVFNNTQNWWAREDSNLRPRDYELGASSYIWL